MRYSVMNASDEILVKELRERGYTVYGCESVEKNSQVLNKIFHLRREGRPYEDILDKYLLDRLGRVI